MEVIHRLACKRCQLRKIKCSKNQPCTNCATAGASCVFAGRDARKKPVSHQYLSALETRVAWFESFVKKLQVATDEERNALLSEISLDDHLVEQQTYSSGPLDDTTPTNAHDDTISLTPDPSGGLQYHGPTSIFARSEKLNAARHNQPAVSSIGPEIWSHLRFASAMGINESLLEEALSLFFLHQYPQYMFVYREAFLADYLGDVHGGRYWSLPLVYSVCALGAAHSQEPEIHGKAHLLAKCAEEIIISDGLYRSRITTMQALLCLAFHELGQGNSAQGWMFSGMAFRMGQSIGFHQDPSRWISQDHSITTEYDIEIRRRIYWGCYVADKFISLYLGRPVYLPESDAAVYPTISLPDFPEDHEWFGLRKAAARHSLRDFSTKPVLTATLQQLIVLAKIFQDMMSEVFSPGKLDHDKASVTYQLGQLNLRLSRWHTDIPNPLKWSRWSSQTEELETNVVVLHLFYHSIRISLNRHFISTSPESNDNDTSFSICMESCDAICAIIRQVRKQRGMFGCPLILVYALVMAAITIAKVLSMGEDHSDSRLTFLLKVLQECAKVYRLAHEASTKLFSALPSDRSIHPQSKAREQREDFHPNQDVPADGGDQQNVYEESSSTLLPNNLQTVPTSFDTSLGVQDSWLDANAHSMDIFSSSEWAEMANINEVMGDLQGWFSLGQ